MGVNCKGSQGQTERAVALYEEEDLRFSGRWRFRWSLRHLCYETV